jgi:hypothetical protein
MAYTKHTWYTGEVISQESMNAIENQLESSSNEIDDIKIANILQENKIEQNGNYINYGYDNEIK